MSEPPPGGGREERIAAAADLWRRQANLHIRKAESFRPPHADRVGLHARPLVHAPLIAHPARESRHHFLRHHPQRADNAYHPISVTFQTESAWESPAAVRTTPCAPMMDLSIQQSRGLRRGPAPCGRNPKGVDDNLYIRATKVKLVAGALPRPATLIRPAHPWFHGSMTSIPHPSKSLAFRVATAAPRARPMAAIWQSS